MEMRDTVLVRKTDRQLKRQTRIDRHPLLTMSSIAGGRTSGT